LRALASSLAIVAGDADLAVPEAAEGGCAFARWARAHALVASAQVARVNDVRHAL